MHFMDGYEVIGSIAAIADLLHILIFLRENIYFKVKGSNNDGIWNEQGTINVKVIPLPGKPGGRI